MIVSKSLNFPEVYPKKFFIFFNSAIDSWNFKLLYSAKARFQYTKELLGLNLMAFR